jgi:hypothetical protein
MLKTGTIDDARIIQNADEGWTLVPNVHLIEVDVGFRSQVVGLDNGGDVFFRTDITEDSPMGSNWYGILDGGDSNGENTPSMKSVTMCANG